MIEITRSLVRQFRAVVRQSLPPRSSRPVTPLTVTIKAGPDGLFLSTLSGDVAIAYRQPGSLLSDTVVIPLPAFDDFEGRSEEKVTLEKTGPNKVQARWHEGVVPRVRVYPIQEVRNAAAFPVAPKHFSPVSADFLRALAEARHSVAHEAVRYALNRVQLRGAKGEVVGTDGSQLLIQSGFTLPWQEDVLIPALSVFGMRELAQAGEVQIGRTATHVCLQIGPWTFHLTIDRDGRYPRVEEVIPHQNRVINVCRLAPTDADILRSTLPRLVNLKDEDQSITLDLNGRLLVRAKPEGQERDTEVVLERATASGPAVRVATNARYLQRALDLGLTKFHIVNPTTPILAQRDGVRFVWMPLGTDEAVPPSGKAHRVDPPAPERKPLSVPPRSEPRKLQLRRPEPVVQVAPVSHAATTERRPTGEAPRLWNLLRTLFTPRGWLSRNQKPQ